MPVLMPPARRPSGETPKRLSHPGLTLLALCTAVLVAQVDTSVVNLAVRPIGEYFHAEVGTLQWVVDSYNLVYAVLLLTGGLLADMYGRRRIFVAGAAVFTIASLLCAFSPSIAILIGGRALAGLGAALLLPASLSIIRVAWPDPVERGRALGIWAACNGLAFVIGPALGGVLIGDFGWRSIFLVVVPFGVLAFGLAFRSIPESSDWQHRRFDMPAQIFGALALGGLAVAAIESHSHAIFAIIALFIAALSLVCFIRVEARKGAEALVPLDMFGIPEFRGAVIATAGMTFGMYGVLFLLPLTWQSTGKLDPISAGLALMPMALVFVLVSPFSGWLAAKYSTRVITSGGVAAIGFGLLLMGIVADQTSLAAAELGLALTGFGMGLATGPLMGTAVGAVSAARAGTAAALINVARMTGATIGVAVLGGVFAISQGGSKGLRHAMLLGSLVQIACTIAAWVTTRSSHSATTQHPSDSEQAPH